MSKAQDKLKKELLEQVSKDVQNSQDPQKEAFKLVSQTFETYKIFESALKKPLDDELLKQKAQQKKNVQFADTIKAGKDNDRSKSVENKINEPEKQTQEPKPIQQKVIPESNKSSTKENKIDKNIKKQPQTQTDKKQSQKLEIKQPVNANGTKRTSLVQQEQQQQQKIQEPIPVQENTQPKKQVHSESEGSSDYYENQKRDRNQSHSCRKHSKEREIAQKYEEIILKNNESAQQLQFQINEYNIDKTKLITENTKLNTLNELLQKELKTVNQQLNQQKKQIEELDKQIYEQKQSSRQELLILKDQLQEQKFQCAELENRNGYLAKAKDTFEQNLKQFEQEVARLQKINMQQTSVASSDKLAILEKDGIIERLQKTNHQISVDLDQLNKQYKETSEKHKQLLVAYNKLENERNQMSSELEFRKTDQQEYLNSLKDKINKLTSSKQAYDDEISKLTQQAQEAKAEREQYKLQYEQLKILCSESEELRKRLKLKEVENEQLQCENDKLKWKVRKDPNGILSDLKIMKIQAEDPNAKVPLEQLSKLDNQIRQLQEENNKLTAENKQLLKQIQQTELYVQEVKSMFDRERAFLEEKVYNKEKEINDLIIKQRHEIVDLENKYQEIQRRYENDNKGRQTHQQPSYVTYNQQSISQQSGSKPSPYSVPQLQAKIKSYI